MIKTTLAWKYLPVQVTDLPAERQAELIRLGAGQVPTATLRLIERQLWDGVEALAAAHPTLVPQGTPWDLRELGQRLGALGIVGAPTARRR